MQIDLTQEEINLIQECFTKPNLALNRDGMILFVNQTGGILQKFQSAISSISSPAVATLADIEKNNG